MADPVTDEENILEVYSGREIALSQSYSITSETEAKLILIIGPFDSGKTTFISRLFDKFLDGPIDSWSFVGTETPVGYEKLLASYRSKSPTGRPRPDRTTKSKDPELFHLHLRPKTGKDINLLIGNLSGEVFKDLIANSESLEDIKYFQQAEHISIVLDGEKMQNKAGRSFEITNARTFLERLVDAKFLNDTNHLSIIIAKMDAFKANQTDYLEETISRVEKDILSFLKDSGLNVAPKPLQIISEPFKACAGFGNVISAWTNVVIKKEKIAKVQVKSTRAMDHYKAEKK